MDVGSVDNSASIMNDLAFEKTSPPVQTERVKEERKLRKQAKRFDSSDGGGQ